MDFSYIRRNYSKIKEEVSRIAKEMGVPEPLLVAVTKSASEEEVRFLVSEIGVTHIAENRTVLFNARYDMFDPASRPKMHLIGNLQTNKVKTIVGKPELIQSVDSLRLAKEIDRQSEKAGVVSSVLLEINSGREENKGGCMPEEAEALAEEIAAFSHLSLEGVMTMGPLVEEEAVLRRCFRETREIFCRIGAKGLFRVEEPVLSMGMSGSYGAAIREGATMIRVGRGLFIQ